MTRLITVAPGLELDDEMYETALGALRRHAPDEALTWERFTRRENWILVPDANRPDEPFYKAELTLRDRAPWTRTLRINLWRAPDLRRDGTPVPHSHPWPFNAYVLLGGYQEDRYEVSDGHVEAASREHRAGDTNEIPLSTFHEVTEILEPGRTLTLTSFAERRDGDHRRCEATGDMPDPEAADLRAARATASRPSPPPMATVAPEEPPRGP